MSIVHKTLKTSGQIASGHLTLYSTASAVTILCCALLHMGFKWFHADVRGKEGRTSNIGQTFRFIIFLITRCTLQVSLTQRRRR